MDYINRFQLIRATLDHKKGDLDYKRLLSTIDRDQVTRRIEKLYPEWAETAGFFITEEPIEEEKWSKLPEKEKREISGLNEKIKKSEDLEAVIKTLEK